MIHSHNVVKATTEELMCRFQEQLQKFKDDNTKQITSGIFPRYEIYLFTLSRTSGINFRVKEHLGRKTHTIGYGKEFCMDWSLFAWDGLLLNACGAAHLTSVLNNSIIVLLAKYWNQAKLCEMDVQNQT